MEGKAGTWERSSESESVCRGTEEEGERRGVSFVLVRRDILRWGNVRFRGVFVDFRMVAARGLESGNGW